MIPPARSPLHRLLRTSLSLGVLLTATNVWAQLDDPETPEEAEPTEEVAPEGEDESTLSLGAGASADADAEVSADATAEDDDLKLEEEPDDEVEEPQEIPQAPGATEEREGVGFQFKSIWQGVDTDNNYFGWDGGYQTDVGYADYRFSTQTYSPENFYDFRGQAWLGPVFRHAFGPKKKAYVGGTFQMVAWLREEVGLYQVNVFDAYAEVGYSDFASLSVGRVTTWRVYQPGNGFDIFTLEDTGALRNGPIEGQDFYPYTYELNYIWLRDTPGRGVVRLKPLKPFLDGPWNDLGLEFAVQYGKKGLANQSGYRGAIIYDSPYVRLGGGYEKLRSQKAQKTVLPDLSICEECWLQKRSGFGGNFILHPPYINVGGNWFKTKAKDWKADGSTEDAGESDRTTLGGFVELHTGHLLGSRKNGDAEQPWYADQRSDNIRKITVGFGLTRTEVQIGNRDFLQHIKRAAYIKYNLGFNRSAVKFVLSKADGLEDDFPPDPDSAQKVNTYKADMLAGRVRFEYYW